jgi:signal peptidase II
VNARATVARTAAVAVAVIVLDQAAKALVRAEISRVEQIELILGIELVHTRNTGVAFSMLSGGGPLVVVLALVAVGALLAFFATHLERRLIWLPTGLLLGGAAGNLIDRIRLGAVTDFIKFPHFPAFNVADMAVTFGVIALIYVLERKEAERKQAPAEPAMPARLVAASEFERADAREPGTSAEHGPAPEPIQPPEEPRHD